MKRAGAMAAFIAALSFSGASQAANVVSQPERLWPTRTIDVVICDTAGTQLIGNGVCRAQASWVRAVGDGPALGEREAETVREAIARWNEQFAHNIQLREVRGEPGGHYLVFRASYRDDRCSTRRIGFSPDNKRNYISIGSNCYPREAPGGTTSGVVLHEIMHAIGAYHEQQRYDRTAMLRIDPHGRARRNPEQWQPLCAPARQHCDEEAPMARPVGAYDFESIMHYSVSPVTAQLTPAGRERLDDQELRIADIGQRDRFSPTDIRAVELLYPSGAPSAAMADMVPGSVPGSVAAPGLQP